MFRKFSVLCFLLCAIPSAASASVEDFSFERFEGHYVIFQDDDGSSLMTVTERIVPVFTEYDQNRGLVRYLPLWYGRLPLETQVMSLTDQFGNARPVEISNEGDWLSVDSVVPEGSYLHGRQEFILS